MYKERKILMLPTDQDAPFDVGERGIVNPEYKEGLLLTGRISRITPHGHSWAGSGIVHGLGKPQHLYIVERVYPLEPGTWVYDPIGEKIRQLAERITESSNFGMLKVIATTDSSLYSRKQATFTEGLSTGVHTLVEVPKIPEQLIEDFVIRFNEWNPLEKVLVDYDDPCYFNNWSTGPVVRKDGTISTKLLKENWKKQEVAELLRELANDIDHEFHHNFKVDEWIENYLI